MTASKRLGAIEELRRRLEAIQIPTFWTDAGKTIMLGEAPPFGPDDPDTGLAIVVGDSTDERQGLSDRILCRLTVAVQGFAKAAPSEGANPFLLVEQLVADIKRAVEKTDDPTLGGWCLPDPGISRTGVRTVERQPGSEFVGASVEYLLPFEEMWGKP